MTSPELHESWSSGVLESGSLGVLGIGVLVFWSPGVQQEAKVLESGSPGDRGPGVLVLEFSRSEFTCERH